MPYVLFHDLLPELAERETRTVTILGKNSWGLPKARYSLLEMYCNERGCDCRRVFFYVVSSRNESLEAVVAYGWETPAFYARWLKDDDPHMVAELGGPVLNLGSPQSLLAPGILQMIRELVLADQAYVDRLKAHYATFRRRIDAERARRGRTRKARA